MLVTGFKGFRGSVCLIQQKYPQEDSRILGLLGFAGEMFARQRQIVVYSGAEYSGSRQHPMPSMCAAVWGNMPIDVVAMVLGWLPVSSICRFKAVCRLWKDLITHMPARRSPWLLLRKLTAREGFAAYDAEFMRWMDIPLHSVPEQDHLRISTAGDGLLVVTSYRINGMNKKLYVCNPVTGSWLELPRRQPEFQPWGFAVIPCGSRSYRIVAVGKRTDPCSLFTEVYDSATRLWSSIQDPGVLNVTLRSEKLVAFDGSLYCISYPLSLLVLDVELGTWLQFPVPEPFYGSARLAVCDDCLLIVGPVEEETPCTDITKMWHIGPLTLKLWKLEKQSMKWVEISNMPRGIFSEFYARSHLKGYDCSGIGPLLCFHVYGSLEIITYNLVQQVWGWLPMQPCTYEQGDVSFDAAVRKFGMYCFTFHPRTDLVL